MLRSFSAELEALCHAIFCSRPLSEIGSYAGSILGRLLPILCETATLQCLQQPGEGLWDASRDLKV